MSGARVLVAYASRHGATRELAEALARDLVASDDGRRGDLHAAAVAVESRPDPSSWDAIVLGSAVYAGRWLPAAHEYAVRHASLLRRRPLWLFSSGPIGEPPFPADEPHDADTLTAMLAPRGHRILPGRLDAALLGFAERAMVTAMRAPLGDFRDWDAVRAWAGEIAGAVAGEPTTVVSQPPPGA